MTDTISKNDGIVFENSHIPDIKDGVYSLSVEHAFSVTGPGGEGNPTIPEQEFNFAVLGPRFSLDPQMIRSVFPPDKSIGRYLNVLPHIMFNRSTLPWERSISSDDELTPWLALIVLHRSEVDANPTDLTPKTIPVSDLIKKAGGDKYNYPDLSSEVTDPQKTNVIDVSLDILRRSLPTKDQLKLLSHVRYVIPEGSSPNPDPPEDQLYPVLVGLRLPTIDDKSSGRETIMHLVSLEGYKDLMTKIADPAATADKPYRMVTLTSWRFACIPEKWTFSEYISKTMDAKHPKDNLLCMNTANLPDPAAAMLDIGYVPLPHQARQGNHIVSWFRGPFIPGANQKPLTEDDFAKPTFQASASDQLTRYIDHVTTNKGGHPVKSPLKMLDLSYASAWEVGRLLTLQSRGVSVDLFNWKRRRAHAGQPVNKPHLPFLRTQAVQLPSTVAQWFRETALLKHVPFNYLVPHPEMLPKESLRFFKVDSLWLGHLLDGVSNIGRVLSSDPGVNTDERRAVWQAAFPPTSQVPTGSIPLNGFLLRSHVVAGWPHMHVQGYTKAYYDDDEHDDGFAPIRMDRLGKDLLLCLFDQDVKTIDLFETPEGIHFGISIYDLADPTDPTKFLYFKPYRDYKSGEIKTTYDGAGKPQANTYAPVTLNPSGVGRLDLETVLKGIQKVEHKFDAGAPDHTQTPWWVALQMIEGVQKVRVLPPTTG